MQFHRKNVFPSSFWGLSVKASLSFSLDRWCPFKVLSRSHRHGLSDRGSGTGPGDIPDILVWKLSVNNGERTADNEWEPPTMEHVSPSVIMQTDRGRRENDWWGFSFYKGVSRPNIITLQVCILQGNIKCWRLHRVCSVQLKEEELRCKCFKSVSKIHIYKPNFKKKIIPILHCIVFCFCCIYYFNFFCSSILYANFSRVSNFNGLFLCCSSERFSGANTECLFYLSPRICKMQKNQIKYICCHPNKSFKGLLIGL